MEAINKVIKVTQASEDTAWHNSTLLTQLNANANEITHQINLSEKVKRFYLSYSKAARTVQVCVYNQMGSH